MSDLKMSSTGDLYINPQGDLEIHTDFVEGVRQNLTIRLKFFKGEWFRNELEGIPYYQDVLVKNPSLPVITTVFRKAIISTPGVASLTVFLADFDPSLRKLSLSFDALLDDGQTLTFTDFVL